MRCWRSRGLARFRTRVEGIKQRGQGQSPKFLIVASKTLREFCSRIDHTIDQQEHVLFRIVSGIGENSRIKSISGTITAGHDNSVLACVNELLIEKNLPLLVEKFPMAVCKVR
jgi:hypothetical protein